MSLKQLTAFEDKKIPSGEVGDKVSSTRNVRAARLVLAGVGVNGIIIVIIIIIIVIIIIIEHVTLLT